MSNPRRAWLSRPTIQRQETNTQTSLPTFLSFFITVVDGHIYIYTYIHLSTGHKDTQFNVLGSFAAQLGVFTDELIKPAEDLVVPFEARRYTSRVQETLD